MMAWWAEEPLGLAFGFGHGMGASVLLLCFFGKILAEEISS